MGYEAYARVNRTVRASLPNASMCTVSASRSRVCASALEKASPLHPSAMTKTIEGCNSSDPPGTGPGTDGGCGGGGGDGLE
eukprot:4336369-Prymnesium_polylepis.1